MGSRCILVTFTEKGDNMTEKIPLPRRKRVISRSGFGKIFDDCLNYAYQSEIEIAKQGGDSNNSQPQTFTKFLEKIAENSGISVRNLARIRANSQMPEMRILKRLSESLPALKSIVNDYYERIRVDFSVIALDQALLPNKSVITIASGFQPPRAFESPEVAEQLALNLFEKDIKYVFLYPSVWDVALKFLNSEDESGNGQMFSADFIKNWITDLRHTIYVKGIKLFGANWSDEDVLNNRQKMKSNIILLYTDDEKPESVFFWSYAPSYLVLKNLFAPNGSPYEKKKFGIYWDHGFLPFAHLENESQDHSEGVEGWTYLEPNNYKIFERVLKSDIFKDENGKHFKQERFPRPGEEFSQKAALTHKA
jgi:hypothetical protein